MTESKNKIQKIVLLTIGVLLLIFIVILISRNIQLKNNLKEMQNPIITTNGSNENKTENFNTDELVVTTGEQGLWDKEGKVKIELIRELSMGGEEGESEKVFYRPGPVKADAQGNIYVAETWTDGIIKKFDSKGNFLFKIGNKGSGPGEFLGSCNFIFEEDTILTIFDAGNSRITRFSSNGQYLNSIQLKYKEITPPSNFRGVVTDKKGDYFVSFFDLGPNKVIHKFNPQGDYAASFGEPFKIRDPHGRIALTLRRNDAPGRLAQIDNDIFFTQSNPYEIRRYSVDGNLKMKIMRKNTFMPANKVEIKGNNTYIFTVPASSTLIGMWQKMLINCVYVPPYINEKIGTVIDIFNIDGELLASITLKEKIVFSYLDQQGRIYGKEISDSYDKIVRYSLNLL